MAEGMSFIVTSFLFMQERKYKRTGKPFITSSNNHKGWSRINLLAIRGVIPLLC